MQSGAGGRGPGAAGGGGPGTGDPASLRHLGESAALSRAALLARKGRLAQAEALLLPLAGDPHAPPGALDLLAKVYAQQGRLDQARSLWARALEAAPGDPRCRAALERCDRLGRTARPFRWWRLRALGRLALGAAGVALVAALAVAAGHAGQEARELRREVGRLSGPPTESPAGGPAAAQVPDLRAAVAEALRSVPGLGSLDITVAQEGRVVRLVGALPTLWVRRLVEAGAAEVPGVEALDLRGLRVDGRYEVQPGDTLWSIAAGAYGNGFLWGELAGANGVGPPYLLRVGQVLELPVP